MLPFLAFLVAALAVSLVFSMVVLVVLVVVDSFLAPPGVPLRAVLVTGEVRARHHNTVYTDSLVALLLRPNLPLQTVAIITDSFRLLPSTSTRLYSR